MKRVSPRKRRLITDLKKAAQFAAKRLPGDGLLDPARRLDFAIGFLMDIHPEVAKALELIRVGKEQPLDGGPT